MADKVVHTKPVGPYEDFDACVAANRDKDDPQAYCAAIERDTRAQERLETALRAGARPDVAESVMRAYKDPKAKRYVMATLKGVDEEDMEADVVITNADMDRDKEIVDPKGMTLPKPKRVPLVSSHQYGDLRKQIGDVPRIKRGADGEITAKPRWFVGMGNGEADWAFELVKMGVAAFSIGFIPQEWEDADLMDEKIMEEVAAGKRPIRRFTKWELAEVSQVIVPSNRGAVQRMVEAGILQKDFKLDGLKDEPMEAKAQAAFEAALKAWKEKQEATSIEEEAAKSEHQGDCPEGYHKVDGECVPKDTKPRDEHGCEPGHEWNPDTGRCEKKDAKPALSDAEKAAVAAYLDKKDFPCPFPFPGVTECMSRFEDEAHIDNPGAFCAEWERTCGERAAAVAVKEDLKQPVDIMALFASAARKDPEPTPEKAKAKEDLIVVIKWEDHVLPKLQEALEAFRKEIVSLLEARSGATAKSLTELEAKINDAVAKAISDTFGPDSAAHTKTKDLIAAVLIGVREDVDLTIAKARGNVDAWS